MAVVSRRIASRSVLLGSLLLVGCSSSKPDPDQTRVDTGTHPQDGKSNGAGGTSTDSSGQEVVGKTPGPGWGEQQKVGEKINNFSLEMSGPVAALNERGEAIVAWASSPKDSKGRFSTVYAAVYKNNAWQPPFLVCPKGAPCQDPRVAINDRGDMAISYERIVNNSDDTMHSTEIWVRSASQWTWNEKGVRVSRAEPTGGGDYVDDNLIALDNQGRALMMWKETDTRKSAPIRLQTAYFDGQKWGAPMRLDQRLPSHVDTFSFSWNGAGQGVAIWLDATQAFDSSKPDGGQTRSMAWARPFANGQWGSPQRLIDDPENKDFVGCTAPRVGVDAQGNAVVGFTRKMAKPSYEVVTRRYTRSSQQWGASVVGVPSRVQPYLKADLDVNNKGEAALAWYADDPSNDKHQRVHLRYLAANGASWGDIVNANEKSSSIESDPVVGIQGDGHIWLSWRQPSAYYPDEVRTRSVFGPEHRLGPDSVGTQGTSLGMVSNDAGHVMVYGLRTIIEHSPSLGYYVSPWARIKQPQ